MGYRLSRISTRTGDAGQTGLGDGARVAKSHLRIHALGEVDELSCWLGLVLTESPPMDLQSLLTDVQHDLFDLGAELSIPGHSALRANQVEQLDTWLAQHNAQLGPLEEFILPGGCRASALLHLARSVCRRAERSLVSLSQNESVNALALQYINRLSDLLFVLARIANLRSGHGDIQWQRKITP